LAGEGNGARILKAELGLIARYPRSINVVGGRMEIALWGFPPRRSTSALFGIPAKLALVEPVKHDWW
jgi:hypothetical protein